MKRPVKHIFFWRKKMKRLRGFLFLLVFTLTVSQLFAGGGSARSSGSSSGPTPISIFLSGGGRTWRPDLPNYQELMRRTNTTLDVIIPPSGENVTNAINLLFASGDLPDIIAFSGLGYRQYVSTGYLRPLDDLLRTQGRNVARRGSQEAWDFMKVQGRTYAYPREGNTNRSWAYARKDWLNNVGMDLSRNQDFGTFGGKVVTLSEFREILTRFTRNDPDKNGRNDTYGLSGTSRKIYTSWANIYGTFGGIPGHYYITNDRAMPWVVTDQYREGLQYINSLWRDGLIDPEVYLHNTDQARQKMVNSVSGAGVGEGWSAAYEREINGLRALVPEAEFVPLWLTSDDGRVSGTDYQGSIQYSVSITTASRNPERVMEFLDFLHNEDEGYWLIRVGMPGQDYNMVNGFPVYTDSGNGLYNNMILDTLWPLINRLDLVQHLARRPTDQWDLLLRQKWEFQYMAPPPVETFYTNAFYGMPNPTAANEYGVDVTNWIEQSSMAFITGETPINDANWNNYINTWKRMGGVRILQGFINDYNSLNGTRVTAGITE